LVEFQVDVQSPNEDATVVAVAGELDLHTASELDRALMTAFDAEPPCVIVDLAACDFVDSTALGVLIKASRAHPGKLALVTENGHLLKVLKLTGVDSLVPVYASRAAVLEALVSDRSETTSQELTPLPQPA
jgi:anti-sigma B factor antagonist